ncbi:hypothetical protein ACT9XH_01710 [Methanococcoides methylutens]|uniref:hypothetical protein n=1 Tax=Methanococcoides methylutens TaxID=2226 RepID=UPI0040448FB7
MRFPPIKQMIYQKPAVLGLSISIILLIGFLMQEYLLGRFTLIFEEEYLLQDFWIAVVHCLLAGYLPSAYFLLLRGTRNTFEELEHILKPPTTPSYVDSAVHIEKRKLVVWGLLGVLVAVLMPYQTAIAPWDPSTWYPEVVWHRILEPFIGWWAGWFFGAIWVTSTRTSRLATRIESVDLLDLSPLFPFVKQGLLTTLLTIGMISIFSLLLLDPGEWPVVARAYLGSLAIALIGFWLPMRGVHQRIHEIKEAELKWTRERIHQSETLLHSGSPDISPGHMADLIAHMKLIGDVPEWPFESLTIVHVIVYLLIPMASWLGGLLIESLLEIVFAML